MFPSFLWLFRSSEPTVCSHPSAWYNVILELFFPLVLYSVQLSQLSILSFCIFVLLSLIWKLLWTGVQKHNKIKVFVQRLMTCTHVPSSGESDNYQNRTLWFFRFVFAGKKSGRDGRGRRLRLLCFVKEKRLLGVKKTPRRAKKSRWFDGWNLTWLSGIWSSSQKTVKTLQMRKALAMQGLSERC